MAEHPETVDERLARLGRATDEIRPNSGFADRVMLAIEQHVELGWLDAALSAARPGVFAAAVAAAAAVGLAVHTERVATEARAIASTAVGIDW
jgi:hypothetical protein